MTEKLQEHLKSIKNKLFPASLPEGQSGTCLPCLNIYRFRSEKIQMPQRTNPYVYVVLYGSIRLYTPSGIMDYIAGQYSLSQIDTSLFGHGLTYSEEGDFLALSLDFTLNDVISVVLDLEGDLAERIADSSISEDDSKRADEEVIASVRRLVLLLDDPIRLSFMAKHLLRETVFNILCGSCGCQFLQSMVNISQAGEIYEINSWIKEHFRDSFSV